MSVTTSLPPKSLTPLDLTTGAGVEAIVAATTEARLVLLGEATHGDGATFAAKAALAEHLHARGGFDALAWEAGSYDCHLMDEAFARGDDPISALRLGVHGIWVAEEVRPLASYISRSWRTKRPFRQFGFDTQYSSIVSTDTVADHVAEWLAELRVKATPEEIHGITRLARGSLPMYEQLDDETREQLRAPVLRMLDAARRVAPETFVIRVLDDLLRNDDVQPPLNAWVRAQKAKTAGAASYHDWADESDPTFQRYFGMRDTAMANNLLQDMDRRPDDRFLGWLANGHAIRNVHLIGDGDARFTHLTTMGGLVHRALGSAAYVLVATSYAGAMADGSAKGMPLPAVADDSLEAELHRSGFGTAFLDLRGLPDDSPWRQRREWRAWGAEPLQAPLAEIADGVVFIDEQHPAHSVSS